MVNKSLSHTIWECKYHIVWVPKKQHKVAYGKLREKVGANIALFRVRKDLLKSLFLGKGIFCEYSSNVIELRIFSQIHHIPTICRIYPSQIDFRFPLRHNPMTPPLRWQCHWMKFNINVPVLSNLRQRDDVQERYILYLEFVSSFVPTL